MRKIINDTRFCHPAGFGKRDDACFLVVHPDKYAERFIYYFFTVSYYHTRLFLIGYEDTDFVLSICTPVLFFSARCKYIFIYILAPCTNRRIFIINDLRISKERLIFEPES